MPKAWILAFAVALGIGLGPASPARADQALMGATNLPGQDITSIPLEPTISGASICAGFCIKNRDCNSWTLVRSGVQGPKAMCWLKRGVPAAVPDQNCQSGVVNRREEAGVDRPGNDYKRNIITGPPRECRETCERDPSCVAWTYVNRGVQGPAPICYLKSPLPDAVSNNCCTSGVVRGP